MAELKKEDYRDLLQKYKARLEKELDAKPDYAPEKITTKNYKDFRQEFISKKLTTYEQLCDLSQKILNVKPDAKKAALLQEAIDTAHLNITPSGAISFSLLAPIVVILIGVLFFFAVFSSMFLLVFFVLAAIIMIKPLGEFPIMISNTWRLKTSNQMVLCIFYVVTYMRHTSNLENAIGFAAEHLSPPLALDLKKILWDIETEKYSNIKDALEIYLDSWKKWNGEFVESFHLIESSLFEGDETRRIQTLDKALEVILEGTYDRMLHYAHNLKSPITMLNMLGIVLPILGLVILPLVVSFMGEAKWYHISIIYNVALPIIVYLLARSILSTRPTGYGETEFTEANPEYKKYKNIQLKFGDSTISIKPVAISILIAFVFLLIGFSPVIMHIIGFPDIGFGDTDETSSCEQTFCLLDYSQDPATGVKIGPFSLIASLLSLFVTTGAGLSIGLYYKWRSEKLIDIRDRSKKLEQEFAAALFQLGNRLSDGIPAELAVEKVAATMKGSASGDFFSMVSMNIRRLGYGLKQALFDPLHGAILFFPSNLIQSSMKVLTESIRKGPVAAAHALINVSKYIKEIERVNERLKDLMADIISSISTQIKFLTPAIAGIVVGITSMISAIIRKLNVMVATQGAGEGGAMAFVQGIDFKIGIPTYYFQLIVGIYVVQIIYILTILSNGIENGADTLAEQYALGKNLVKGTLLYVIITLIVMLIFNSLAIQILPTTGF